MIAMHGVFDPQAGDKYVAVKLGNGLVGNQETVPVVVQHETPAHFVAGEIFFVPGGMSRAALRPIRRTGRRCAVARAGAILVAFATGQAVTPAGHFGDGPPFFELAEHLKQTALL
jgi:hypothetical protein